MSNQLSRRVFLSQAAKSALIISGTAAVGSTVLSSCSVFRGGSKDGYKTGFSQSPLGFSYNSLDRAIDGLTMEIHYSKHAAGYATNLQDAARNEGVSTNSPLEDLFPKISKYSAKLRNNAGGHYNHELFWKCLSPDGGGQPSGKLLTAIETSFNSFDSFKTRFSDAGKNVFGSGWAWLFLDKDKNLRIESTPNQDNPLMDVSKIKGTPIMGLDVWEHAYYLRYQNKRADYINAWWNVVNWKYIGNRFEAFI